MGDDQGLDPWEHIVLESLEQSSAPLGNSAGRRRHRGSE